MNHLPADYRIMKDGNDVYWIEREYTTLFLRRKVWRPIFEFFPCYDGGDMRRKQFDSKEAACAWLAKTLEAKAAARLHHERSKQRIEVGPCG